MGSNTFRNQPEEREPLPLTYWRRRFIALVVGLAILAVIAWAFSGAIQASGGRPMASVGHGSPGPGAHARGAHGNGDSSGSGAAPSTPPAPAPTPTPVSSPSPAPSPTRATGAAAPGSARACKPGDVVLSLFASQDSYATGQLPEFDVDVVSTSARTCAFNVGPRFLALVITAGGKRIWSSADCVAGRGSLLTDLARGVPTVLPLSWDRETSAPGCGPTSRQVTTGSFAAAASDGGLASNSVTFRLS
jgi:hypothetical protein